MKYPIVLAVIFLSIGCNKKDASPPKSTQDLLINKKWKVVSMTRFDPDGITVDPNYFTTLPAYEKDDYYFFRWASTYEINENGIRRPFFENQIYDEGTWSLTEDERYLELQSNNGIGRPPIEILAISETELKFRWSREEALVDFVLKPIP